MFMTVMNDKFYTRTYDLLGSAKSFLADTNVTDRKRQIANLVASEGSGKLPEFNMDPGLIDFITPYITNKYLLAVPEFMLTKNRKTIKNYVRQFLHLYYSSLPHFDNKRDAERLKFTEGVNIAFCSTYVHNQSRIQKKFCTSLKNNRFLVYRFNMHTEGICERYLVNSSFFLYMDELVKYYKFSKMPELIESDELDPKGYYKEEYIDIVNHLHKFHIDRYDSLENFNNYINGFELSISDTPFSDFELSHRKMKQSEIFRYRYYKIPTFSPYGRVFLNRHEYIQGVKKEVKYTKLFEYFGDAWNNYDIVSSQISITRHILSEFISLKIKYTKANYPSIYSSKFRRHDRHGNEIIKYKSYWNERHEAGRLLVGQEAYDSLRYIDEYLSMTKEEYLKLSGIKIPVQLFKIGLYTTLFGGNIMNPMSNFRKELAKYTRYDSDRMNSILDDLNNLGIFKAIRYIPKIIKQFDRLNLLNLIKNNKDIEYRNGITNINKARLMRPKYSKTGNRTVKLSDEKFLMNYYLQGYESYFIMELTKNCLSNGIKVYSNEFDGIITDKEIPESIIEYVNRVTGLNLKLKNKPLFDFMNINFSKSNITIEKVA